MREIGVDDRLDGVGDLVRAEAAADDLADRGVLVGRAAERDLIELGALLLDAENADMADMVVAAGVDAAGNLQLQLADVALPLQRGEALGDVLRDDDRAGIGQRAIVEAGAGDDVGDQVRVGGRKPISTSAS